MTHALKIPGALQKPLRIDPARDPKIVPVGAVFHVAVSEAASLLPLYQSRNDGIESTGYIRRDGTIEQYRPLDVECDAQLAGNSWVIGGVRYGLTSWETQGMGPGDWTPQQLASIKQIIAFHHTEWACPLRVNPGPQTPGFGYHRLFKAWNPNGHSCPGDDRVHQFDQVIRPWLVATAKEKAKEKKMNHVQTGRAKADVALHDLADAAAEIAKAPKDRDQAHELANALKTLVGEGDVLLRDGVKS